VIVDWEAASDIGREWPPEIAECKRGKRHDATGL